jgi:DNA polymerase epsilon subunit 1
MLTARLKKYCQRVYKRVLDKPIQDKREAGICMRENSFYIDTVRSFRDRRYEYKGLNKKWGAKLREATASKNPILIQEAADYCVLYDSLQLAHKCILNSFYGYVMRKGARWYSMEMAGVVTHTGAKIIQHATRLVEAVGKPLELDTDGIWCCLPSSFPDTYNIKSTQPGKAKYEVNYPCVVLNKIVVDHFTNEQMQTLTDPTTHTYETSAECSIEFEVDGPYKAMILPASKEAGKLIKKRYAVFNDDGSLAELKGFEIKRRGELKLIKVFQSEVFSTFLEGDTLETAYGAVGGIANRWLDMLDNRGCDLADSELMELIGESTTLSKSLEECGDRKSNAITCATRLGQFLGAESIRDKVGLACHFIVSKRPIGAPTSQRAIPVNIFSAEPAVARSFLRQWTKDTLPGDTNAMPDVRDLVDWDYYTTRLGSAIQKIITIPAALQNVLNPVPRVVHPDWLGKVVRERNDTRKQFTMADMFQRHRAANTAAGVDNRDYDENRATADVDMEDLGASAPAGAAARRGVQQATLVARTTRVVRDDDDDDDDDDAGGAPPAHEAIMPDKALDYRGWLACMKRKWKAERLRRTRQRTDGGAVERGGGPMRLQAGQTLGAFFRRQEAAVTHVRSSHAHRQ